MTNDMMSVRTLVEKSADADLLREMIGFAAERLMKLEVGSATGADFGEKNRCALRNATATVIGIGRREPERSSFAFVVWHFCGCRPFGKKFLTFLDV